MELEHVDVVRLHADEALFDPRDDIVAREDVGVPLAPWGRGRADHTAALARQVVLGAPGRNVAPDTLLAESVVDRGIDVVDTGVEHGVENGFGLRLGDLAAPRGSPQLHRAVPQHRDLKPSPSEFPFREISHVPPSIPSFRLLGRSSSKAPWPGRRTASRP